MQNQTFTGILLGFPFLIVQGACTIGLNNIFVAGSHTFDGRDHDVKVRKWGMKGNKARKEMTHNCCSQNKNYTEIFYTYPQEFRYSITFHSYA